jgi:hypothetical protein
MAQAADDQPNGAAEVDSDPAEDLKRKYREALDRKHGHDAGPDGHRGGSKTGPAKGGEGHTQRMFRRKSGG